jgi:16S rRNA (adenine1518-N6/adenine1519-N6)-dimethyltransferase
MPITNISELKTFLNLHQLSARRMFSQNFLIDQNIVQKILLEADIQEGDIVLEIGPGPGALTEQLLKKGATVYAVEYDRGMAKALQRFDTSSEQLHIFCEDFLDFSLEQLPIGTKVVANLPYHISSPILEKLFSKIERFSTFVLMLQQEYVQRIKAVPSTKNFSSLTLFVQFFCTIENVFSVSHHCFYPAPKVDSSIIHLTPKHSLEHVDQKAFFSFVRKMFMHRRKSLRKNLGKEKSHLLEGSEFNPLWRPENLDLKQWIRFFKLTSN